MTQAARSTRIQPLWLLWLTALLMLPAACSDSPPPQTIAGLMGNGNVSETQTTPQFVGGLTGVRALAAGFQHTCALRNDRSMVCWGSNNEGQLGTGDSASRTTPTAVLGGTSFGGP